MKGFCEICEKEIEVKMCCNGWQCSCAGLPVEPPVCSNECYDKYINPNKPIMKKKKYTITFQASIDVEVESMEHLIRRLKDEDMEEANYIKVLTISGEEEHYEVVGECEDSGEVIFSKDEYTEDKNGIMVLLNRKDDGRS